MKINLNNNFWPLFGIIILLGIGAIILMQHCEHREPKWDAVTGRHQIAVAVQKKDSVKIVIQKQVEQVIVYRDRWHRLKDTIRVPSICDTIFTTITQACDSVIRADSLLISSQQAEIALSDSIISRQNLIIRADSFAFCEMRKEIKKQKRKKVLAWITAGIAAGLAIAR